MNEIEKTEAEKHARAKKTMLWIAIGSIVMLFAGLTSAYVVSQSRPDWLRDFQLPQSFFISTAVIVLSSAAFQLAKIAVKKRNHGAGMGFLVATLLLGIAFVYFQFRGFSEIIEGGHYFTGSQSNITTSFLYVLVISHLVHLFSGLVMLLVVIYNHSKKKYQPAQMLGLEMAATFWHFLDFLWVYLILFFYFTK